MLWLLPTLFVASVLAFLLVRLVPGGPAAAACGTECTPQQQARIEKAMGLQRPLYVQYGDWVQGLLRWHLGPSLASGSPIQDQLRTAIPVTLELGLLGMAFAVLVALPAGIACAVFRDSPLDYAVRVTSVGMLAIPTFWLAILLIALGARFSVWAPPLTYVPLTNNPIANLKLMWMPSLLLAISLAGTLTRLVRAEMLDVLRQDYIRTARAKGLREAPVVINHALRNTLIPVITILGTQVTVLIGGSVILETIFNLPGMGRYLFASVVHSDIPVIQVINFLGAALVVSVTLLVDVVCARMDPRIRLG
ncbi:MAG TPA: hypothetical protein DEV93_18430 [Chloroflexi bacterium]|nr:hypothetical protein [Chloroflexota bacterium]